MTETQGALERLIRIEALLELQLIQDGHANSYLSEEQRNRRLGELGQALWPQGNYVRAGHERNPMNHVFDSKRAQFRTTAAREATDVGTDRH